MNKENRPLELQMSSIAAPVSTPRGSFRSAKRAMRRIDGETYIVTLRHEEDSPNVSLDVYSSGDSRTVTIENKKALDETTNDMISRAVDEVHMTRLLALKAKTQAELAEAVALYREWENNKLPPSLEAAIKLAPTHIHMRIDLARARFKLEQYHICISQCKRVVAAARLPSAKLFGSRQSETVATVVSNAYELMGDALQHMGPSKAARAMNVYLLALRENPSNPTARPKLELLHAKLSAGAKAPEGKTNEGPGGKVEEQQVGESTKSDGRAHTREIEDLLSHHDLVDNSHNFKFQCTMCGECCRQADNILLTPIDVWLMARSNGLGNVHGIHTTIQLRKKFKKAFHWTSKDGLPVCYLRPLKAKDGRCHFSFPLYRKNGKLLSYSESTKLKLDVEEEYVPVSPDEYNITEEEEKAAMDSLNLSDSDDDGEAGDEEEDEDASSDDDGGRQPSDLSGDRRRKRGMRPKGEGQADAVWNSYGRHALECMLGMENMPHMCSGYPVAQELSWADFWHVRDPNTVGAAKHADGEKIVIVRTDACEGFFTDEQLKTQPFESVDPTPGPIKERPIKEFIDDNGLKERWNHVDSFMALVQEVTDSKIIPSFKNDAKRRLQFQKELADIWYNADRLAGNPSAGLEGNWRTVERAVASATRTLISEFKSEMKK